MTDSNIRIEFLVSNYSSSFTVSLVGPVSKTQFFGGEIRQEGAGSAATVALGVQGPGFNSPQEAIAAWVLQRAAGNEARVKWGAPTSPIGAAVAASGASAQTFFQSYSDAGLFGVVVSGNASNIGQVRHW